MSEVKNRTRAVRGVNGKAKAARKGRARKLVREMYGGEPYEYYPLGEYIVAAPGVCGGRPTFKYTRIEVVPILEAMANGWTVEKVVHFYRRTKVTEPAVREAIHLASAALLKTSSVGALAA